MGPPPWTPLQNLTDAQLVELALGRDKTAFGLLVQRYEAPARTYAARLAGKRDWASEVFQEALLEAYLSLEHLRDPAKFGGWLRGIVLNVHRRYIRQGRDRAVPFEAIEERPGFGRIALATDKDSPQAEAEREELRRTVIEALKTLPHALRETVLLFYFEGLSIPEIASATGASEAAVKVRLHRARQKLRSVLKGGHPKVGPQRRSKQMLSVSIADVVKYRSAEVWPLRQQGVLPEHHVVLLHDEAGKRVLPIWVGPFEGESIATGMEKFSAPRPMTYDFMSNLLKAFEASVEEVRVETLKDDTFYAIVKVRSGKKVREIDARPSDALAIAVRTGSPIFVAEDVMNAAGLAVPEDEGKTISSDGIKGIVSEIGELVSQYKSRQKPTKEQIAKGIDELRAVVFKK